eukprot:CAMPEP_0172744250 /NCGR_PEP_ID=MMETSP1074-20121228/134698_1 /TAXON_ID=2916 /ORGANISM="Ceratium fusus, Strain PA161109" /LENGTH=65 /DNA_ID=CAMNT_0013575169 /DNA_START=158 /DNA_END=355 /DNA_ORIENTATION=+
MADLSYGNSTLELATVRAPGGGGHTSRRRRRPPKSDTPIWKQFLVGAMMLAGVACCGLVCLACLK